MCTKNSIQAFELGHNRLPSIALMGLSFKPNIDDLRQSSAVYIAQKVLQEANGETYFIVEPNIDNHPLYKLTSVEAIEKVDIIAFLVGHSEFK